MVPGGRDVRGSSSVEPSVSREGRTADVDLLAGVDGSYGLVIVLPVFPVVSTLLPLWLWDVFLRSRVRGRAWRRIGRHGEGVEGILDGVREEREEEVKGKTLALRHVELDVV